MKIQYCYNKFFVIEKLALIYWHIICYRQYIASPENYIDSKFKNVYIFGF